MDWSDVFADVPRKFHGFAQCLEITGRWIGGEQPRDHTLATPTIQTVDELRVHVKHVLCAKDHIDPAQAELRQARLMRGSGCCGMLFQLRGPRLLRTYAIWSEAEQRILFYESTGIRFAETKLENGPRLGDVVESTADELKHAS